jgi:large subunit ribosomal protein L18
MAGLTSRYEFRKRVHRRIRKKVAGSGGRPRLAVFRSNKNIYAQLIDDVSGVTLASAASNEAETKKGLSNGGNVEAAKAVGRLIAERAKGKGLAGVVFDRGGYIYHGRVQALAESAREAGLKF